MNDKRGILLNQTAQRSHFEIRNLHFVTHFRRQIFGQPLADGDLISGEAGIAGDKRIRGLLFVQRKFIDEITENGL